MPRSITRTGTLRTDYNAPNINITWDPLTNGGMITFAISAYDYFNDEFVRASQEMAVTQDIPTIVGRKVMVGDTEISGLQVMMFIKGVVNQVIDERDAAEAAAAVGGTP